ncbi:MAG: hypothetical protein CMM74_14280 [Rhodospirillaceae bacterium]|nr:hypothetical protein [Rhodospirillaceae bacterium]
MEELLIWRTFRKITQLLGGLGAGLAIVMILLAWKLSSGPISLAFLSPYVETALNPDPRSFRIRLDNTILTWAGWERTLDIRVVNVRAFGQNDALVASIPELSLSLSPQALMQGILAPKSIELFRPKLRLIRHRSGEFQVDFIGGSGGSDVMFRRLMADLLAAPGSDRAMSYLSRFNIFDADLTITDQTLDTSWRAPAAQARFKRDAEGIKGEVRLGLQVGDQQADLVILGDYLAAAGKLALGINFREITPALFSDLFPELRSFDAADLPLAGTVSLTMMADGSVDAVGFEIAGGRGRIGLPKELVHQLGLAPYAQKIGLTNLTARGSYDGAAKHLEINDLSIDFVDDAMLFLAPPTDHEMPLKSLRGRGRYLGLENRLEVTSLDLDLKGPSAHLSAVIDGVGNDMTVDAKGILKNLAVNDFSRYWPRAWGTSAQAWSVSHLSEGNVSEINATLGMRSNGQGGLRVERLDGDMDIEGITVDYLPPMPKVKKVFGKAKFTKKRFDITISSGEVTDLTLHKGSVFFTDLDRVDQFADIELFIGGPLKNALRFLDSKPLGFASAVGINPSETGGASATHLKLRFIVENALTLDQVEVSATSRLKNVSIAKILLGQDIKNGGLDLKVDKRGMDVTGEIELGSFPAFLGWRRNFGDKVPFRNLYDVNLYIKDFHRISDLGLDLGPLADDNINGDILTELRLTDYDDHPDNLEVTADLTRLAMEFPALGWSKGKGIGGMVEVDLILEGDLIVDVPRFALKGGGMVVQGSALYTADGGELARINLDRISYDRTDISGAMIPGEDGDWTASFYGASFNLAPMFEDLFNDDPKNKDSTLRYSLSADFDRVWLGPNRGLRRVVGTFSRDGNKWRGITLDAEGDDGKRIILKLEPSGSGNRRLSIKADNAGTALKTFGFYENMVGGTLEISGEFDDSAADVSMKGELIIKNYRVIRAPVLAHLVSIMSLTGIPESLQAEGLAFTSLESPFYLNSGVLEIKDTKITGLSLGFTASGKIYTNAEVVDLKGTVVPAYAINAAFGVMGKIPILGPIFTGEEKGGGVFAATYTLTGPIEDPELSMNPLTVLAPGIFRKLFGLITPDGNTSELPEMEHLGTEAN